jgi:hypothetical protein
MVDLMRALNLKDKARSRFIDLLEICLSARVSAGVCISERRRTRDDLRRCSRTLLHEWTTQVNVIN